MGKREDDDPRPNSPEDIGHVSAKDEGPRGFSPILVQVDDGQLHDELSAELQKLVAQCRAYSDRYLRPGKGTLTLNLTLIATGNGTVSVQGDVKTKPPKGKRAGSMFFVTPGNNLSVENQRQQKLPLREVPQSTTKPREINEDRPVVRNV
jgi:hypothetical protein